MQYRRFIRNPKFTEPKDAGTLPDKKADGQKDGQQDNSSSSKGKEEVWQEETDD
tara:strand:+ start:66 stop:227 length:162 start_codon:yes stop_codon:yes gene_type:complete